MTIDTPTARTADQTMEREAVFILAGSRNKAYSAMRVRFPDDKGFTCQLWQGDATGIEKYASGRIYDGMANYRLGVARCRTIVRTSKGDGWHNLQWREAMDADAA